MTFTVVARKLAAFRDVPRSVSACALTALVAAFLFWVVPPLASQEVRPTERQVKAAYIFNFGKFVTWPADRPSASDQFQICILGKDPFGAVLDATVNGESMNGKAITIKRLPRIQDAVSCNILFVSSSEEGRVGAVLSAAEHMSLLTVSDMKNFAERGGEIGLIAQGDRIRFEVNLTAAGHAHLALSSQLLKVAVKIIGQEPTP